MGLFKFFKKKDPLDGLWERTTRMQEGRKLADKAISYRNVGNFDKALELLERSLSEFDYWPAITLIGTTTVLKGDIENAIRWFELQIKERESANDYPLIELYANLGSIHNAYRKDYAKALEMYAKALESPRPSMLDDEGYAIMESNVYHDMAIVYTNLNDGRRARECAQKHLRVQPECSVCRKTVENVQAGENQPKGVAGGTAKGPTEGSLVGAERNAYINSLTNRVLVVYAECLAPEERVLFSRWGGLREDEWTPSHQALCALAMMHYLCNAEASQAPVSEAFSPDFLV